MNQFLERLLKLKLAIKVGITAGVVALIVGAYYMIVFTDLQEQIEGAKRRRDALRTEKTQYEKRKVEYLAYRNELNQLQEEQRELLKALPKRAEIETFMQSVQEQLELAGLRLINMNREGEQANDLYVKIPVKMEVRGTYHQLARFFKNTGDLRRIVNIEGLSLTPERIEKDTGPTKMRARFTCSTFRFVDKGGG